MNKANTDIIDLILEDHRPLKTLIKTLKGDAKLEEKFIAFEEFAPALNMHAKPEEQTMYIQMKDTEEAREAGFEGDVEHELADQLVEEIKRTKDEDLWMARVKVLAELVEHHLEEEENELLPKFKKTCSIEDRQELAKEFLKLKEELGETSGDDAPPEVTLETLSRSKSTSQISPQSNRH